MLIESGVARDHNMTPEMMIGNKGCILPKYIVPISQTRKLKNRLLVYKE